MQIIIVSGLSGAGKSTALKILEDSGYYCVDNLPTALLEQLIQIYKAQGYSKIAIGVDTKSHELLQSFPKTIKILNKLGVDLRIIYLETHDDELIKRFSETRRKHPLSDGVKTIAECIIAERDILANISNLAHRIDTTGLSANNLRNIIKSFVDADYKQLNIIVQSFGFKYGLPVDSDFVFDVRCLPNPHYDKEIRDFNGTQEPIINFLSKLEIVSAMRDDIYNMVHKWLDTFSKDNRNYLTISIGCTGGKHRSVYLTEQVAKLFKETTPYNTIIRHRQLIINEK